MIRQVVRLSALGAAIGAFALPGSAQAGHDQRAWCPPAYRAVHFVPAGCCAPRYPSITYHKTTQYWPVVLPRRAIRPVSYPPIKARRR